MLVAQRTSLVQVSNHFSGYHTLQTFRYINTSTAVLGGTYICIQNVVLRSDVEIGKAVF